MGNEHILHRTAEGLSPGAFSSLAGVIEEGTEAKRLLLSGIESTILRYLSPTDVVLAAMDGVVAEVDGVVEGTKCMRFRFRPAPKTRWSCKGISYSSSDILGEMIRLAILEMVDVILKATTPLRPANAPHR